MAAIHDLLARPDASAALQTLRPGTAPSGVVPQQRTSPTDDDVIVFVEEQAAAEVDLSTPLDAAWERFTATRCPQAREHLIVHYVPLVTAVAGRIGMRRRPRSSTRTSCPTACSG